MTVKGSFVSQVFAERSRGADGLAVLAFQEIKRSGERGEGSDHGDRPALRLADDACPHFPHLLN